MDENLLKNEDLEGLLSQLNAPAGSIVGDLSDEMKAAERRYETYLKKHTEEDTEEGK